MCVWNSLTTHPDYGYTARLVLNHGVETATSQEPPRTVDGYGAVTVGTEGTTPVSYCGIFVDIAPGKALGMAFDNNGDDIPGMTHDQACDRAQRAAEMMLSNLRAAH